MEARLRREWKEIHTRLLRNDASLTRAYSPTGIQGFGRRLGEALLGNTSVMHISLKIDKILAEGEETVESANPLFRYLLTSASLKEVKLLADTDTYALRNQLGREILQAVALNSNITFVDITWFHNLPSDLLVLLLRTTTSITNFRMGNQNLPRDIPTLRGVAAALTANRTINDLCLEEAVTVQPMLIQQLGAHSTLNTLNLYGNDFDSHVNNAAHYAAVATLISTTPSLQNLFFISYHFRRPFLEPVLNALKMNATITKLSLLRCFFYAEAAEVFVDFVQHHCNQGTSVLRELKIRTCPEEETFHRTNLAHVAASMLVGSSLQSLHLSEHVQGRAIDLVAFVAALSENEDQIRLASLTIDILNIAEINALLEYLPKAVHLRNLTVLRMDRHVDSARVVATLRRNDSLHSATITKAADNRFDKEPLFSPDQLARVQAYGMRNQCLPSLLSAPVPEPTDTNSGATTTGTTPADPVQMHLFTHLFTATRPTVRTAPNNFVKGLLSANQAFGDEEAYSRKRPALPPPSLTPRRNAKRPRL